jgi:hypothetical protein
MWQIVPPGGWHVPVPESDEPLRADSHDDLVQVLTRYRIDNNLPMGNPESEIDNYICNAWPHVCGASSLVRSEGEDDKPPLAYGQPIKRRLIDRIAGWAANRYSRLGCVQLVSNEEAERRSGLCVGCPKNIIKWRENATRDCAPCAERIQALDVLLYKIRRGEKVEREKQLGACLQFGHENQSAVHLSEDMLRHRKHYTTGAPEFCWLLKMDDQTNQGVTSPA